MYSTRSRSRSTCSSPYNPARVDAGEMLSSRTCRRSCGYPSSASCRNRKTCCRPPTRARPVIHQESDVSLAYQDVIARFLGEDPPLRFVDYVKPGLLKAPVRRQVTK